MPDVVVYEFVEVEPGFPGGAGEMMQFMMTNIVCPAITHEMGLETLVYVSFVVDVTGELTCIHVLNKPEEAYSALDVEVLRVVKAMPFWVPGNQQGVAVPVRFILPVQVCLRG